MPTGALTGQPLVLIFVFSMVISVAAVLVALDARDRGAVRSACVLWALGVMTFPPVIFVYIFIRNGWKPGTGRNPSPEKRNAGPVLNTCPYCGVENVKGTKMCSKCGRFL